MQLRNFVVGLVAMLVLTASALAYTVDSVESNRLFEKKINEVRKALKGQGLTNEEILKAEMAIRAAKEQLGDKYAEDLIKGYLSGGKEYVYSEFSPEVMKRMQKALAEQPPHDNLWKKNGGEVIIAADEKRSVTMQTINEDFSRIYLTIDVGDLSVSESGTHRHYLTPPIWVVNMGSTHG
jgi:hypothetical protein